jgi:hypothetical protein
VLTDPLFWQAVAERAVKTFAQTLLAALTMSSAPVNVLHANWGGDLGLAFGAALLSVLTSLASVSTIASQGGQHQA